MRLPLSKVEEALRNPSAYRRRLEEPPTGGFGSTYISCLLDAVQRFHKRGDESGEAKAYLERRLGSERFKNERRKEDTRDYLAWYIEEWEERAADGWLAPKLRLTVTLPRPIWVRDDFTCSGMIRRLDVVPDGGYAAWIMMRSGGPTRMTSIEIPLLQYAVAEHLRVPIDEVQTGVYSFEERFAESASAKSNEIQMAIKDYHSLLRELKMDKKS